MFVGTTHEKKPFAKYRICTMGIILKVEINGTSSEYYPLTVCVFESHSAIEK
jgi:hypothetical protein